MYHKLNDDTKKILFESFSHDKKTEDRRRIIDFKGVLSDFKIEISNCRHAQNCFMNGLFPLFLKTNL